MANATLIRGGTVVNADRAFRADVLCQDGKRNFEVNDAECVGCNLCVSVCPVPQCITLRSLKPGEVDARTGKVVTGQYANWTTHPNNPMAATAA